MTTPDTLAASPAVPQPRSSPAPTGDTGTGRVPGDIGASRAADATSLPTSPARAVGRPRTTADATRGAAAGTGNGLSAAVPTGGASGALSAAYTTADAVGTENLLRCWVRETGAVPGADGVLRLSLTATGCVLRVPVRYWSPAGTHRFGPPLIDGPPVAADSPVTDSSPGAAPAPDAEPPRATGSAPAPDAAPPRAPVDAVTLAALLAREAGAAGGAVADRTDLVARVADSVRRTALFVADRRARPAAPPGTPPFLAAEQALVLGHPAHPSPKSRVGLSDAETSAYSPETRGAFQVHWWAVDRSVLAMDSGWREGGRPVPADVLTARLAGPGLRLPEGTAALPVHPWQARELGERPRVRALLNAGLLRDLGPLGEAWRPTSSVRTLYRAGADTMLKLSLALRITNSRRENLRKELLRGAEVNRLLRGPVGRRWRAGCPGFDIVRDPAWIAVDGPSGEPVTGLDVVLRHVPFGPRDAVVCLAGLTAAGPHGEWRSGLAELTLRLAERTGRPVGAVGTEWFLRYLDTVVRPILRLDGQAGIALEAHQQNTLVALDPLGWPRGGWFRDNQGYYFRASRRAALDRALPGIGTASETFVDDAVADERFAYYLGINNVLGLIGAFGAQRLADERVLLAAFRRFLAREAAVPDASGLPGTLLDSPTLRCKANLLTRLNGLDELVGPVDTQSVYVTLTNPLAAPAA
ncbi:IucA/IucC family protein [Streptantibioticus silvisoli]|uniref:IucA/IucC family protein n=1 Tax=Streptantibioticus silvisoli TaxID=2705255 RepID=UPI003556FEBC